MLPKILIHNKIDILHQNLIFELKSLIDIQTDFAQLSKHPDIHLVTTDKNSIGIEQIKQLQNDLQYFPLIFKYQIGVIDQAQLLTQEAQNSMLKLLEEIKEHTQIYFLASNEKALLKTIISRCQTVFCTEGGCTIINKVDGNESEIVNQSRNFLKNNITDNFLLADNLVEQDKKDGTIITNFLHSLIETLRTNKDKISYEKISLVLTALKKISSNCNKKTTLKNLALEISSQI
jgi:DNA polymerase III delta prime subunit